MTLIAILLALVVERFLGLRQEYRQFGWFFLYAEQVRLKLPQSTLWQREIGVILTFFPILGGVAIIFLLLEEHSLISLFIGTAVLIYSLGPKNLEDQLKGYLNAESNRDQAAMRWYAQEILEELPSKEHERLEETVSDWALLKANHRIFGVIFWFVILGPVGALFYRLNCELLRHRKLTTQTEGEDSLYDATIERLFLIINWLPTRLTAFTYAVTGNFVAAYEQWRRQSKIKDPNPNTTLLMKVAKGAVVGGDAGKLVAASFSLVKRSLILWFTVLALMTITGWLT